MGNIFLSLGCAIRLFRTKRHAESQLCGQGGIVLRRRDCPDSYRLAGHKISRLADLGFALSRRHRDCPVLLIPQIARKGKQVKIKRNDFLNRSPFNKL